MSGLVSKERVISQNRPAKYALGMGILVALLMVVSSFAGVATSVTVNAVPSSGFTHPVASAPATPASTAAPSHSAAYTERLNLQNSILSKIKSSGVPSKYIELPNFLGNNGPIRNSPGPMATIAPAPMGIGDYGVTNTTGTAVTYTYNTSSFKATTVLNSINPFYMQNDGPDSFGMQLNTILYNVTVGNSIMNGTMENHFWTQNVPSYTVSNHELYFVDNVWNFSNPGTTEPAGTLQGNGTLVAPSYYYDVWPAPTSNGIIVAPPFTLSLYNNATTASATVSPYAHISSENNFGFTLTSPNNISYPLANGTYVTTHILSYVYDKVFFKSTSTASTIPPAEYRVSGSTCGYVSGTFCIPDDAEITTAIGPGGGSTTNLYGIDSTLQLQYRSGTSYANVKAAWDTGSETGETTQGVSATWTTPGIVHLSPGPSIIYPMWNASGTVSSSGVIAVAAKIDPSNAFVFVTPPGVGTDPGNMSWAPTPWSGDTITYNLPKVNGPATTFSGVVEFGNYKPSTISITATTTSLTVSLVKDVTQKLYTPLQAFNNAQLANISSSGSGTAASPYMVYNDSAASLNGEFSSFNDYLFPSFPGLMIVDTTAQADVNGFTTPTMNYVSPYLAFEVSNGLPTYNYMPVETYGADNVNFWGLTAVGGWFYSAFYVGTGFPFADALLWNTTNSLVGSSTFNNGGTADSLLVYNAPSVTANNVIWGSTFTASANMVGFFQPAAVELYSSGNLFYNNNVQLAPNTADTPTMDLYDGMAVSYVDTWNVAAAPSTDVNTVNGYALTGSILGYTWQGGNAWYDCTVPYDNSGLITNGYDNLPLCMVFAPSTFTETGLPAGATWTVNLDNGMSYTSSSSVIDFMLTAANYAYSVVVNVGGWTATPSTGILAVNSSGPQTQAIVINQPGVMNTVTFVPSGIPAGPDGTPVAWSLSFGGVTLASATGGPITTTVTNGTYYFAVSAVSTITAGGTAVYAPHPANGNVTVSGSGASVYVTFSAMPEVATILNPTTGQVIPEGSAFAVAFSYDWMAATNATLTVSNASGFSKSFNVFVTGGVGSGSYTFSLGPGNITVSLSLVSANPGNPATYVNTSATAQVVATTPQYTTVWDNSTVYHNVSSSGFGVNALGAILIVVGIIVGFAIGYFVMMSSRPKTPNSPQTWDQPSTPSEPSKP